ncbi:MAG: S8 family serine peptidase, partial [Chitinophagaceae bacterium]
MRMLIKPFFGLLLSLTGFLLSCSKQMTEPTAESTASSAPFSSAAELNSVIPDAYLVIFRDDVKEVDQQVKQMSQALGIQAKFIYKHVVKGFAATLPAQALSALQKNPLVKYIEPDQVMKLSATQSPATWGIDRVDQQALPLSGSYTYTSDGSTVDAYVFDTGIWLTHDQFGGRAVAGYDAFGGNTVDQNGHGTHVSGTIGGSIYGLAKNIRLIAVRVLDASGSGSTSGVVAGLDWAANDHSSKLAVGNMSLGGGASSTLDNAVRNCVADGIVMCVAAGNSSADASNYSPARVAEAITVGATTSSDGFASFSNYGSIVDILAPGVSITSSWYGSNSSTNTISGTSMATPHVCGVAALYLEANTGATPADVSLGLKGAATSGVISSVPSNTVNLLLYSVFGPPPPPPAAPTLSSPADLQTAVPTSTTLSWNAVTGASTYAIQVATDTNFTTPVINRSGVATTSSAITALLGTTTYYWRVRGSNSGGNGEWSAVWSFTTAEVIPLQAPVLNLPGNGVTGVTLPAR